ncbi:DUF389 domain-containing protein [Demequina gelatinilytica]|uniref:DUF389 domain-containing protein n=1 Tax=Demequina gelatinilytica TaxID=1638980 RepID=UPI0007864E02|nr:DUF389 domain-containing protein [Demequina gelatinilytica]
MDGASHEAIPRLRDQTREIVHGLANGASVRGIAMASAGAAVLMLPGATTWLVQLIAVAALGATALMDLFYAATGRRWLGRRLNRVYAALRGLLTLAVTALLAVLAWWDPTGEALSLAVLVLVLGCYVAARGLIVVLGAAFRRGRADRIPRLASGGVTLVLGVLAAAFPQQMASTVIVSSAAAAIIVGLILVAWGLRRAESGSELDPAHTSIGEVLWDWVRMADVGDDARAVQIEALYFENPGRLSKLGAWWVMLVLSVAIATYAILADSTAVVIGAMLVAPLMTPIVALAGALVNGWARRAFHSAVLVGSGMVVAILLSYGLAAWSPVAIAFATNSQITSRVAPTVVDMLVAIAAGAAGAFATVNSRVSSSIAGVAIAVALVPPLAVVGVSLSGGRIGDASGALLLFLTNFVAIVLSACAVFVITGFAHAGMLRTSPRRVLLTLAPFVILAGLVLLPLMVRTEGQLVASGQERNAEKAVEEWLGEDTGFVIQGVTISSDGLRVVIQGPGEPPPAEELQEALKGRFGGSPALSLIVIPVTVTELPAVYGS